MTDRWYVARGGAAPTGPFSRQKLKELAEAGRLLPTDQVCPEGGSEWSTAGSLAWLFPPLPSAVVEGPDRPRPLPRIRYDPDDDDDRPRSRRRRLDPDDEDDDRPRFRKRRGADGRSKTLGPAIGLYVTGLLALAYGVGNLAMQALYPTPLPPAANEAERVGQLLGWYGAVCGLPVLPVPVLIGAFCLHTCRVYPMAMIGCIIATIPCCSPLIVVGIPFGVWGLIALNNEDVKRAFSAEQ
jgi:hypothetical protein